MSKDDDHPVDRTQGIHIKSNSILKPQHNHSVSLPDDYMFILNIREFDWLDY